MTNSSSSHKRGVNISCKIDPTCEWRGLSRAYPFHKMRAHGVGNRKSLMTSKTPKNQFMFTRAHGSGRITLGSHSSNQPFKHTY